MDKIGIKEIKEFICKYDTRLMMQLSIFLVCWAMS